MTERRKLDGGRVATAWLACTVALGANVAWGQIDFEPSWKPTSYDSVRSDVRNWLRDANLSDEVAEKVRELWPATAPEESSAVPLLDRTVDAFAAELSEAAELRGACQTAYEGPPLPDTKWLADGKQPPFVRNNLRLYYARWLAQHQLYDEVLEQLADLQPADVVDPASLLFYRVVAHHQLVQPDEARAALVHLMEREAELPRRFQQVAQLVQRDLAGLEDESLDHIARRMHDIRRRLDDGRAGPVVQQIEQSVLDSLDKKIKELEQQAQEQQQQQQAQQGGGGRFRRPSAPMQDSMPAELKAPMQVDKRDIGHGTGWGDMPPKEREQALQEIGREFPGHYRTLIEQYFRELANEPTTPAAEKQP
jgi:hypothetical protein